MTSINTSQWYRVVARPGEKLGNGLSTIIYTTSNTVAKPERKRCYDSGITVNCGDNGVQQHRRSIWKRSAGKKFGLFANGDNITHPKTTRHNRPSSTKLKPPQTSQLFHATEQLLKRPCH